MASNVYPVPSSGSSSSAAFALQAPLASSFYYANQSLVPGVYSVQSNTYNSSTIYLYNGNTLVATYAITNTSQIIYIPSSITEIVWNSPSSTNATFYITLVATISADSLATLYTFTSNGTWPTTCKAYVIAIGGGGGGGGVGYKSGIQVYGSGGASGGVVTTDLVQLTAGTTYTIGQGGNAGSTVPGSGAGTAGSPGTATVFGSYTANGGGGGQPSGVVAVGGTPNGGNGGYGGGFATLSVSQSSILYSAGVTTSGGSSGTNASAGTAAPTGTLGTGATGAWVNGASGSGNAGAATGYGSGGGGAAAYTTNFATASAGNTGALIILALP
jgi:hypothetical protein